jgi:hypothetical protein
VSVHNDSEGKVLRTESIFRDISERKKAGVELQAEKDRLETVTRKLYLL